VVMRLTDPQWAQIERTWQRGCLKTSLCHAV